MGQYFNSKIIEFNDLLKQLKVECIFLPDANTGPALHS